MPGRWFGGLPVLVTSAARRAVDGSGCGMDPKCLSAMVCTRRTVAGDTQTRPR